MKLSELKIPIIEPFLDLHTPARYKIYYGGRGGAKSWAFADALLWQGYRDRLRILCARELQNSIQESVHKLLSQRIRILGLGSHYEVLQKTIRGKNGTEFIFDGVKNNVAKLKSLEALDRVWLEEADKVSENSWQVIVPTIRKEGSEIWCSFNTGSKHDATYQRFIANPPPKEMDGKPYCIVKKVSWRDNPYFPDELKVEMERMRDEDYEQYLHIWEGDIKLISEGAVYGKQLRQVRKDKRILNIPIQPSLEVHTFWDFGRSDATAIWFMQRVGMEFRFIDYYEDRLQDIDHYVRVLRDKDYLYGRHYMPHDVEHDLLVSKRNIKQQFEDAGIKPIEVVPRIRHINEGIEMTRDRFPSCYFDEKRCEKGIEILSNYKYKYSEDRADYSPEPLHDWASHGADAFRMFAQGFDITKGQWDKVEHGVRKRHQNKFTQDLSHII